MEASGSGQFYGCCLNNSIGGGQQGIDLVKDGSTLTQSQSAVVLDGCGLCIRCIGVLTLNCKVLSNQSTVVLNYIIEQGIISCTDLNCTILQGNGRTLSNGNNRSVGYAGGNLACSVGKATKVDGHIAGNGQCACSGLCLQNHNLATVCNGCGNGCIHSGEVIVTNSCYSICGNLATIGEGCFVSSTLAALATSTRLVVNSNCGSCCSALAVLDIHNFLIEGVSQSCNFVGNIGIATDRTSVGGVTGSSTSRCGYNCFVLVALFITGIIINNRGTEQSVVFINNFYRSPLFLRSLIKNCFQTVAAVERPSGNTDNAVWDNNIR